MSSGTQSGTKCRNGSADTPMHSAPTRSSGERSDGDHHSSHLALLRKGTATSDPASTSSTSGAARALRRRRGGNSDSAPTMPRAGSVASVSSASTQFSDRDSCRSQS